MVVIFARNVSAVYFLNGVMVMVVSSDLKFFYNPSALWTNGGGTHLHANASSLLP